jgi:hypothetical protein
MNHLLHLFVELWIHKGGCAISVQHYLRMAPFHCSYMEKWHKSFIFPKLKMISVQNVEDNTSVVHVLLDVMFFCRHKKWWPPFFHKISQTGNLFQDNLINFFIHIISITEKNGLGGLYQWPLIWFSILLRNNCHNGGHFEHKMAAMALKFVVQIYVF